MAGTRTRPRPKRTMIMRFLTDTWLVFSRAMRLSLRNPVWVILGLMQPILYLILFGPLLGAPCIAPGFRRAGLAGVRARTARPTRHLRGRLRRLRVDRRDGGPGSSSGCGSLRRAAARSSSGGCSGMSSSSSSRAPSFGSCGRLLRARSTRRGTGHRRRHRRASSAVPSAPVVLRGCFED